MNDFDLEAEASFLRRILVSAPEGATTLDEILDGFTPERAQAMLDSTELFEHLVQLTQGTGPGPGWVEQAREQGGVSRALLQRVLAKHSESDTVELPIRRGSSELRVGPPSLLGAEGWELAHLEQPGGQIGWSPLDLHCPPVVHLDWPELGVPAWVAELAGKRVAEDLAQGKPSSTWNIVLDEPHPAARYALGCWLEQHLPMTTLSLPVLRLELGALAHEFADLLPEGSARNWLLPLGSELTNLQSQIPMWSKWEGVEQTFLAIRSAFLATCPDTDEVKEIAIDWPEAQEDYALAAGSSNELLAAEDFLSAVTDQRARLVDHYLAFPEPDVGDPERPFLAELLAVTGQTAGSSDADPLRSVQQRRAATLPSAGEESAPSPV